MTWMHWVIVGYLIIGAVATVALVGEPRKPIEPAVAATTVLLNGLLIAGLVVFAS